MATNAELFDYGIHNEASNIRAHVAPLAKMMFVFPTICAVRVMQRFPKRQAYQSGVDGPTALGYLVPPNQIEYLRCLAVSEHRLTGFEETLSTSEKGRKAVEIVSAFLKGGRFPLWLEGEFISEESIQITGTDLIVKGFWKIEVKCDYRASRIKGAPDPRCTGHLFLQIAERNPMRRI